MKFEVGQKAIIDVNAKALNQAFIRTNGVECTVTGEKNDTHYEITMDKNGLKTHIRKAWLLPASIAREAEEL